MLFFYFLEGEKNTEKLSMTLSLSPSLIVEISRLGNKTKKDLTLNVLEGEDLTLNVLEGEEGKTF